MRRTRNAARKAGLETRAGSDVTRQQLGWYVRNCALSPAAGMLERVMLAAARSAEGRPAKATSQISNSMTIRRSMPGT